jgi:hypothetical protein
VTYPVTVGKWVTPNAYPMCVARPSLSNANPYGPLEVTNAINIYVIWYNNATFPWTTANKNYIRAFFNNIGSTNYWTALAQYPDPYGNVPATVTVAAECDDPESEGTLVNCVGGGQNSIVGNHLIGGTHASQCANPSGLPIDTRAVYFVLPSWADIASSNPLSCHGGAQTSAGGPVVQTAFVNYSPLSQSQSFVSGYYAATWNTSSVFNALAYTQPSFGNVVTIQVNAIEPSMVVGEPLVLQRGSGDYYTITSIGINNRITISNDVAFLGSNDPPGMIIPMNNLIYDLSGAMLPSMTYVISHELIEAITDPTGVTIQGNMGSLGWGCGPSCPNTTLGCSPVGSACGTGGNCRLVTPINGGPGEGEVMDGCAESFPYGWTYAGTSTVPTWTGTATSGNPAMWGVNVSGTQYDFVTQGIFQGFAGFVSGTGVGVCAQSFVGPPGGDCSSNTDCEAPDQKWVQRCVSGHCIASTCSDGILDGDESDVDCGGFCATGLTGGGECASTKNCRSASDCSSGVCNVGKCN